MGRVLGVLVATLVALGAGATAASAAVTISGPATVTEGSSGTTDVTYTLTRGATEALGTTTATVALGAPGTASCPGDVVAPCSQDITFATLATTASVVFKVVGDTLDEDDETIVAAVTKTSSTVGTPGSATTTITDDDATPTVTIGSATVTEGTGSAATTLALPVTLSAASGKSVTVTATVAAGTADAADATLGPRTATIPAGQTSGTIAIPVTADDVDEDDETLTATLTAATNAGLGVAPGLTATGTITDDDTATLAVADAKAAERAGALPFPVTLSVPSAKTVTVAYATADYTATAPADYTATSGTLTFAPGETTKTITVPVVDDAVNEPDEVFSFQLSAPAGATTTRALAAGIITNDDGVTPNGGGFTGGGIGSGGSGGAGGGSGGDDTAAPDARLSAFKLKRPSTLTLGVSCPGDEQTCTTTITIFTTPQPTSKVRRLRKELKLGKAVLTLAGGKAATATIKVSAANAKLLKQGKKVKATAFAVTRDAAGNIATTQLKTTLRA